MPSLHKIKLVENYKELIKGAKAIYVVDFKGLNVPEITILREKIKESKGLLKVGKNRLFKIILKENKIEGFDDFLSGISALLFAYEDPVEPLKVFYEFSNEKEKGAVKGGYIEGRIIGKEEISALAKLPSRSVLIQNLVSGLQSPMYGFLFVLNGLLRSFLYVLNEIKNKKEGSTP